MDPASVIRTLWRHKVLTVLLVVATAAGMYHVVTKPFSQYDARASVLLVPPRGLPPELAASAADNPYLRDYNPSVVISIVSASVNAEETRERLVAAGADPRYEVLPPSRYGISNAIVQMVGTATTAEGAAQTVELVVTAFDDRLRGIQLAERVDERLFIRSRIVRAPSAGIPIVPSRTRAVAGVLGLGVVGLFSLLSSVDFVEQVRRSRRRPLAEPSGTPA